MNNNPFVKFIRISDRLLFVKFSSAVPSDDEFDAYLDTLGRYLYASERMVVVMDTATASYLCEPLYLRYARWFKEHTPFLAQSDLLILFTLPHAISKLNFLNITKRHPLPTAHKIFPDLVEAMRFLKKWDPALFEDEGVAKSMVLQYLPLP